MIPQRIYTPIKRCHTNQSAASSRVTTGLSTNAGEYVRYTSDGDCITTNRIEGFWAGLKRQISGTHHSVSRKHLQRYVSEAEFKYSTRDLNDGERTAKLIQASEGRRLTYAELVIPRDRRGRRRGPQMMRGYSRGETK